MVECPPDMAVVYVYRLHTPPVMLKPDIKVRDVAVAALPTDSYTVLRLKPGTYAIKTDWGFLNNPPLSKTAILSVEAGISYYVNFAGKLGIRGTTATYGAQVIIGEATTIPPELTTCTYVAPNVPMPDPQ